MMASGDLFAVNVFELGARLNGERVLRIKMEKVLIGGFGVGQVAQVALINLGFGEQSAETEAGSGVLMPQEFVLADGVAKSFLILEHASFFGEQVGNRCDGGIGFRRPWIAVIDGTVGIEDVFVLQARALLFRPPFESFVETFGPCESGRRLRCERGRGCCEAERCQQKKAPADGMRSGGQHRRSGVALHRRQGRPSSTGHRSTRGRERLCRDSLDYRWDCASGSTRSAPVPFREPASSRCVAPLPGLRVSGTWSVTILALAQVI
jgi:hypothetical protein